MRQDMPHITRIRTMDIGGPRKLITRGYTRDMEDLPSRLSTRSSVPHYSYPRVVKFKPIQRWLNTQVGRHWNTVYAELRQHFDHRNLQQAEMIEQAVRSVERQVHFDEDGQPMVQGSYGSWAVCGLYVHPETGLLQKASPGSVSKKRETLRKRAALELAQRRIDVSETLQLHCVDGLWYWVELAPITEPELASTPAYVSSLTGEVIVPSTKYVVESSVCVDAVLGFKLNPVAFFTLDLRRMYGQPGVYAKRKWQANRRDLDRYVRAAA